MYIPKTIEEVELQEQFWIQKSRKNFLAYRQYIRHGLFIKSWFTVELCRILQKFYVEYKNGLRPIYIINTPPQHGKSFALMDFISWVIGIDPTLRIIFGSYADRLGKRCNTALQRTFAVEKYSKIFPNLSYGLGDSKQNSELIEFFDKKDPSVFPGYFRNTTVNGAITGDSMDIGVIDDPVKGRKEARSQVISEGVWEWFENDFDTRMSEYAGILLIMTRWTTHDLAARIQEREKRTKLFNFQAISTQDESNRPAGHPLFPQLKSLEFLLNKKQRSSQETWESVYQGNPTVTGGNLIKDEWWRWWTVLPPIKYKFITADTAMKDKEQNDYSCLHCYGVGINGNLYMLDKKRGKWQAPDLEREAAMFYNKHNTPRENVGDPILRGMYIEDKASGIGLIQRLKRPPYKMKIYAVPRNTDKYMRVDDASPYIEMGCVYLNEEIPGTDNLTQEAREFPNCEFDDDLDTLITAIEITYINKKVKSSLKAAMEA